MASKRIKDWLTSITVFRTGDVIPVDGPSGTAKMAKDDLLKETAQNALAGNVAPAFDPTKPNDEGGYAYYAGTNITYEGKNYVFVANHSSGEWNPDEVEQKPLSESINLEGVSKAVSDWLNEHPEATTTVQDGSLTETKFSDALKLKAIKDYVTPEMFGAIGDGVTDDTDALAAAAETGKPVIGIDDKTYLIKEYVTFTNSVYMLNVKAGADAADLVFNGLNEKEIDAVKIDYNKHTPYHHRSAIYVTQSKNVSIRNVLVKNVGNNTSTYSRAIRFEDGCENIVLDCSTIFNVESAVSDGASSGILVSNNQNKPFCHHLTIQNCIIKDIYPDTDADGFIILDGASEVFDSCITICNCKFEGCTKRAMKFQSRYCKSVSNTILLTKSCYNVIDFQRGYGQSINDTVIVDYDGESGLLSDIFIASAMVHFSGPNCKCDGFKVCSDSSQPPYNYCVYFNKNIIYDNLDNIDITNSIFVNFATFLFCENNVASLSSLNIDGIFAEKYGSASGYCFWFSSATMDKVKIHGNFYGQYSDFLGAANSITNGDIDIVGRVKNRYFCNDASNKVRVKILIPNSESWVSAYEFICGHLTLYLYEDKIDNNAGYTVERLAWNTPAGTIVKCAKITYNAGSPIKIGYVCNTAGTGNKTGYFTPITVATT